MRVHNYTITGLLYYMLWTLCIWQSYTLVHIQTCCAAVVVITSTTQLRLLFLLNCCSNLSVTSAYARHWKSSDLYIKKTDVRLVVL